MTVPTDECFNRARECRSRQDELQQQLTEANEKLRTELAEVKKQLAVAAEQLSAAVKKLAEISEEQQAQTKLFTQARGAANFIRGLAWLLVTAIGLYSTIKALWPKTP